jgi:hypothetical protein
LTCRTTEDAGHRRPPAGCIGLDPAAHALGVADAAQLAGGIQEHHDQLAAGHLGLHHQALAGFVDEAGLLQADVPGRVLHQPVGVVELQGALADGDLRSRARWRTRAACGRW